VIQQVNHAVLKRLPPEQVEVEICRAEELDHRRGLTSELDEMWSYVARKQSRGGSGMPLIITVGPCWRMSLGDGRMTCFSNCKSSWPLFTSPDSLPMDGAPTSVISIPRSTRLAKPVRRRSQASTSICGRGSSGSCVVRSVFPKRPRCMISCWVSSSTATNLG
jgi:hypothetical protein